MKFLFSENVVTVMVDGNVHSVRTDDARFERVKKAIKSNDKNGLLAALANKAEVEQPLTVVPFDNITVQDGKVYYKGNLLDNSITKNIIKLQAQGLPYNGMIKFLDRLYSNTSYRVREQLFKFMENKYGLVIDDEGYLLAYKAVNENWTDKRTGTISNKIGSVIKMDRGSVNDDPNDACGAGLHAGSLEYVRSFGNGKDHIVIVKIDPANIVSIPYDDSCQKIRCCEYEVMSEYHGVLNKVVYTKEQLEMPAKIVPHKWEEVEEDDNNGIDDYENEYDSEQDDYYNNDDDDEYGFKPSGHKYHNVRDKHGRFAKKS